MKRFLATLAFCALSVGLTGQAIAQKGGKQQGAPATQDQIDAKFNTPPYRYVKPVAIELGLKRSHSFTPCTKDAVPAPHNGGHYEATCHDYVGRDGNTYRLVIMKLGSEPVLIAKMQNQGPLPIYAIKTDGVYALNGAPEVGTQPPPVATRQPSPEDALRNLLGTIIKNR